MNTLKKQYRRFVGFVSPDHLRGEDNLALAKTVHQQLNTVRDICGNSWKNVLNPIVQNTVTTMFREIEEKLPLSKDHIGEMGEEQILNQIKEILSQYEAVIAGREKIQNVSLKKLSTMGVTLHNLFDECLKECGIFRKGTSSIFEI